MGQNPLSAAERLAALATKLWRAMEFARPKLPASTQAVLTASVGDGGDVTWALALVLAGWRLSSKAEAGGAEIQALMTELGAASLVQQISSLQMLLPDSFSKFVNTTKDATEDYQLAGTATYLTDAIKDLGDTSRSALHGWLKGAQFQEAARALLRRFPASDAVRSSASGASPAVAPPPSPRPTRADSFDRADFTPRRQSRSSGPEKMALSSAGMRPPTPLLDGEAVSRSYLFSLGWEGTEVDRLMSGPSGPGKKSSA